MIYQSMEWKIVEEAELSDEFLIETFIKDIRQTVYVKSKEGICGIITLEDFRGYFFMKQPLIQENFIYVFDDEEKCAEKLLVENEKLFVVPVLDRNYCIIKEYRKEYKHQFFISNDTLFRIYKQLLPLNDKAKNLLITRFENEQQRETAKKIINETRGQLMIIDGADIVDIKENMRNADYQIIYDCIPEYFQIWEVIYKKYNLKYSAVRCPESEDERKVFHDFLLHFSSLGIISQDVDYFKAIVDSSICMQLFEEDKFQWREDRKCYEYVGNLQSVPEALCVSCCLLKRPFILYRDYIIPVISKSFPIPAKDAYKNASSDYDIAYNIIPKLKENGIKTILISDIDAEKKEIKNFDIEEGEKRRKKLEDEKWEMLRKFCNRYEGNEIDDYLEELKCRQVYNKDGYLQVADFAGKYINVFQGERLTVGNPLIYSHTIWLFGPCLIYGFFVDDAYTPASLLRKKINDAFYIKSMAFQWASQHVAVRSSTFKSGDIIIIYTHNAEIYQEVGLNVYSLTEIYQQCPDLMTHVLDHSLTHIDWYLTEKLSDRIYDILRESEVLTVQDTIGQYEERTVSFGSGRQVKKVPEELSEWLCIVKGMAGTDSERTGAIVMNCNPFTLGHRFLIETASMQVDKLLIFVVEEDKSFFKFDDRLQMVKSGTKDLQNVRVIPSGKYIISAQTLPGYFEKDDNPDIVLDAASDLYFFTEVIAKELNIKVRFAGEEPIDQFTRQYNQAMSDILPKHGIDFVEIPRREWNGKVISASRVRELMSKKEYAVIKELVMPQIYKYLQENYFN